jgi:hypothetical protein
MKHLKKFNESKTYPQIYQDVKKLVEDSLVFLLDDKSIKLEINSIMSTIIVKLVSADEINWNTIKYDFIAFIELMNLKYKLREARPSYKAYDSKKCIIRFDSIEKYSERDGSTESFKEYVKDVYKYYTLEEVLSDSIDDIRFLSVNIALDF